MSILNACIVIVFDFCEFPSLYKSFTYHVFFIFVNLNLCMHVKSRGNLGYSSSYTIHLIFWNRLSHWPGAYWLNKAGWLVSLLLSRPPRARIIDIPSPAPPAPAPPPPRTPFFFMSVLEINLRSSCFCTKHVTVYHVCACLKLVCTHGCILFHHITRL